MRPQARPSTGTAATGRHDRAQQPGADQSATRKTEPRQKILTGHSSGRPIWRAAPGQQYLLPQQTHCGEHRHHDTERSHGARRRIRQHRGRQRLAMRAHGVAVNKMGVIDIDRELTAQRCHHGVRWMSYGGLRPQPGVPPDDEHPHRHRSGEDPHGGRRSPPWPGTCGDMPGFRPCPPHVPHTPKGYSTSPALPRANTASFRPPPPGPASRVIEAGHHSGFLVICVVAVDHPDPGVVGD